jgi:hypothetical protein
MLFVVSCSQASVQLTSLSSSLRSGSSFGSVVLQLSCARKVKDKSKNAFMFFLTTNIFRKCTLANFSLNICIALLLFIFNIINCSYQKEANNKTFTS